MFSASSLSSIFSAKIGLEASTEILDFTFETATAIDLAGRDVKEAVQTSVYPKVIDVPQKGYLAAVAKDGIELKARARVTVRTNIPGLIGGATDETIIARVGEGIVSAIGSSNNYTAVLENPDNISRTVLDKGLDAGTAFEILSIDIADLDVGKNIGASLQDRKSTRLNSSHALISYAVFCLKKKNKPSQQQHTISDTHYR